MIFIMKKCCIHVAKLCLECKLKLNFGKNLRILIRDKTVDIGSSELSIFQCILYTREEPIFPDMFLPNHFQ